MSDYIPPELIPNILARLPVDDVLRCTSVCKSWYELITCPSFASLHLNLSSPNQKPRILINYFDLENKIENCYLHRDNQTFDEIRKLDPPVHPYCETIDTINGLVCLYDHHKHTIVLWNPSIRKSLFLPKSTLLLDSQVANYWHIIGFGFVAKSNDYKILKYSYDGYIYNNDELQAEIYQLSTGSWHTVKLEGSLGVRMKHRQAHLNGILHWSAYNTGKVNPSYFICSFNLENDKYATLVVPSCLQLRRHDTTDNLYFEPFIFRELISLIDYDSHSSCKIWVMKEHGVADSWQNLIVISTQLLYLGKAVHFRHNGEILFAKFLGSTDDPKLVSYNCNDGQVTNDGLRINCRIILDIHTYVESLALIKGPNEVKIDEKYDLRFKVFTRFLRVCSRIKRMIEAKLMDQYYKW